MNDPNGPIFYKGVYHLFYQLTPFSDQSGVKYWGHVRSRDLVKGETVCITKLISPLNDHPALEIHAENENARAKLVQAWPIKSIW